MYLTGEEGVLDPMAHLKKNYSPFRDQDESIALFIENIKKLIFLNDQNIRPDQKNLVSSQYDWVDEPEMFQSDSGESKYSNEDKHEKDHLAVGEEAILNALRKYNNADKIVQLNEINGKEGDTSHLVKYLHEMNRNMHIPKGFGFVHRRQPINSIDASDFQITNEHARAMAGSLGRARHVNKLILRNVGLKDE